MLMFLFLKDEAIEKIKSKMSKEVLETQEIMTDMDMKVFPPMPQWVKAANILNILLAAKSDDAGDFDIDWFDWSKIYNLVKPIGDYDYNCLTTFNDIDSAISELASIPSASLGGGVPYRTYKCKCGKQFSMDVDEVMWYKEKELPLPKRCPACRSTVKAPLAVNKAPEEPQPTALELALKKAGVI